MEKTQQNHIQKIQEENIVDGGIQNVVKQILQENQRLLIQIESAAKYRKNKNVISSQMSLLTNKLQRNLIRIARLVPPEALADPSHVSQERQRFLKFYRGRNPPKKSSTSVQNQSNTSSQNDALGKTPIKDSK